MNSPTLTQTPAPPAQASSRWKRLALEVALPGAVLGLLMSWALSNPSIPLPVAPPNATLTVTAITFVAAIVVWWLRSHFAAESRTVEVLPDPLYTLYLAAVVLIGTPVAVLLAAVMPIFDGALELARGSRGASWLRSTLRNSATAAGTTFVAGMLYVALSHAARPHLNSLRAHFLSALVASLVMFLGIGLVRMWEVRQSQVNLFPSLLGSLTSPALRFQLLLLSIGPLLPLTELLDDAEAEFAWTLFLVPLCAVYYLALVSVRLQMRTDELQVTVAQLSASRRREAELTDYAALITRAQEDERRRLARELHDDTAQALIALSRGLDALTTRQANPPLSSYDARFVAELGELSKRTLDSVRRACQDLRPSVLDDLGLPAALESLTNSMAQRGLACSFHQSGEMQACAPEVEVTIYRIAQEALSNVLRHASASAATVELAYRPTALELQVSDNGHGFDYRAILRRHAAVGAGSQEPPIGLGMLGMRERASLIGAHLSIESIPEHGTTVSLSVPMHE